MRWWVLLFPMALMAAGADFRLERRPVSNGAELLTVFGRLAGDASAGEDEVPLVSVLRDTLGDANPDNDRLRYIWVLTSARPSLLQRATASLPFFYFRPDLGRNADRQPAPVLDLGATSRGVWTALAGWLTQVAALDPSGALIRTSTRSYRANLLDHRRVHLLEGLAVLSQLESIPEVKTLLSEPELLEIQARLTLAGQTLGGLVNAETLPEAYFKQRTRTEEMRGHNWELLRQRAEANGLYFEPLGLGASRTHAVLWVAWEDLGLPRAFDGRFLGITDPYMDGRLRNWKGLTVRAYFDASGRRIGQEDPAGYSRELVPLALYSLEYPKVPLLLVDFRSAYAPKRREMLRRATADALSGVLGVSKWGNWPYLAGSWTFDFVRSRHGDANNRAARLKAFSQARRWLALDHSLDPKLREELLRRLEVLGVNPLEESVFQEAEIARRQYAALLRYAADPEGLRARLDRDRNQERTAQEHGLAARTGFRLAGMASLGLYDHKEKDNGELLAKLDRERRAYRSVRFLESIARAGAAGEAAWNLGEVKRALDELAATGFQGRSVQVVERILQKTTDEETRALCERALESFDVAGQ
jgi:hypothetical protein